MKRVVVRSGINVTFIVPLRSQFHFLIVTGAFVMADFFGDDDISTQQVTKMWFDFEMKLQFMTPHAIHEKGARSSSTAH